MKTIRLNAIRRYEQTGRRPKGYADAVIDAAATINDQSVTLTDEAYAGLQTRYGRHTPSVRAALSAIAGGGASVVKTTVLRKDRVDDAEFDRRLSVCASCPVAIMNKRGKPYRCGPMYESWVRKGGPTCGCVLKYKAWDKKQSCPQGKW